MEPTEINFLNEKDKVLKKPKRKLGIFGKSGIYLLIIFSLILISMSIDVISSGENLSKTLGNISLWDQIKHLIGSSDKGLNGEKEDRINILLLGMGGENHDGPYLSDTMMLASFKPSTKQVALISIPRDLSAPIPGYGWWKINHANSFGETKNAGQGGLLSSEVVGEIFDLPIHYYVRIDFAGFEKIIDDLGGVNVEVENTLDDPFYPIAGKENAQPESERYEHIYFEAGCRQMDGERALKFVRSRNAQGENGTDFARSRRQQKVILAIKEKISSREYLFNLKLARDLIRAFQKDVLTDIPAQDLPAFLRLGLGFNSNMVTAGQLDVDNLKASHSGLLVNPLTGPEYSNQWVLIPKAGRGNWSQIQQYMSKLLLSPTNPAELIDPQNSPKVNNNSKE